MFVPLHDENALKSIHVQYVTIGLILLNVLVFILEVTGLHEAVIASFAIIPAELVTTASLLPEADAPEQSVAVPEKLTLLSYMFFHGDIFHLGGNMLFLWVFGDNVEDAMGHLKFLVFYLACGIVAGLMHVVMVPGSPNPLIGASGAVAGVIAAYLMLHPRVRVWVLAFQAIPLRLSAAIVLGFWVVTQFVMVMLPEIGPVAWWAHIGGLIAGAVLIIFLRRPGVPLFDKGLTVV
jgi:membrane associated rhomboid family serine protease